MKSTTLLIAFCGMLLSTCSVFAQELKATPGFNTPIPPEIMTPDSVRTKYLGSLEFSDGRPSKQTADKVYDHLAYLRGVEVFLNLMPACSIEAMRLGHVEAGITQAHQ